MVRDEGVLLRFGPFTMAPEAFRLWQDDREVRLRPKTFETLRHLIECHGSTVCKEELFNKVWPKTHVTESVLSHSILEARQALGDDPRSPRYIRTIPRVGYRFNADVEETGLEAKDDLGKARFSVAVLPLENLSNDPDQEHFVQGMQDALIFALGCGGNGEPFFDFLRDHAALEDILQRMGLRPS